MRRWFESRGWQAGLGVLSLCAVMACTTEPTPVENTATVHALFELTDGPMDFGAIPWPDDLYLDATGHIELGALPGADLGADPDYLASERESLRDLDGFGVVSPIFFYFDGALDAASLTATGTAPTVMLFDVDHDYAAQPVELYFESSLAQLSVRPANGYPLRPGIRYAAVVTNGVTSAGAPIEAASTFAALRDASTRPLARDGDAYDQYTPVLEALASRGIATASVVALSVFRTQTVADDMSDARAVVRSGPAPIVTLTEVIAGQEDLASRLGIPDDDQPGFGSDWNVTYAHVGFMIHGTLESPGFASPAPRQHGAFTRDAGGELVVKRTEIVPFTLWLPDVEDLSNVPVMLYQHGLSTHRARALGLVENAMIAGFGLLAIDAPYHGLRVSETTPDYENVFTGATTADHFGDLVGVNVVVQFAGIGDTEGELLPFHPAYIRDAMRQGAVDLMSATRVIQEGDWSAVRAAHPDLATFGIADGPLAFIGMSLGGIIGGIFVANEPEIATALLGVSGGNLLHLVAESPDNASFFGILLPSIGVRNVDYRNYHTRFQPQIAVWQTLLDRGDAIAYTHMLHESPKNVLMLMAEDDEAVPNVATESYARAVGASLVSGEARFTDIATATLPLSDNVTVGATTSTRAVVAYHPATHTFLYDRIMNQAYAHPLSRPFMAIPPVPVTNPVAAAQAQVFHFFRTWRDTGHAEVSSEGAP